MHFLLICSSKYLICEEGVFVVGTRDVSFTGDRERAKKRKGPIPALTRSAGKISSAVAKSVTVTCLTEATKWSLASEEGGPPSSWAWGLGRAE